MTTIPAWVDGRLTPVDKLDAHVRGLRHKAVSVFVLSGDRLLIQQRAAGKYHTPGLWANTCCTHPHWGEGAEDCARRRLEEELGITGLALTPRGEVEYRADVGGGLLEHEVVEIFTADAAPTLPAAPNPDEVQAVEWVPLRDLDARIARSPAQFTPWLRIYLERHRDTIFGDLAQA
ncbi:isopentenyl-diphosphate Delta-isomerase [Rhodobacteraceae bacterium CCMM004]|nr:isopentenyl-diphosphate Delta-isomerase [Rhodobacteraceae bacterium CCMM004]